MAKKISVANLVMLGGAVVCLLFSFFDFYGQGDIGFSAWDTDALAFISAVPAILALAMIAWIVAELAGAKLPDDVLTFNGNQLKATWGIAAAGLMLAWLTTDFGSADKQIGFWLMLLGSLVMAAGAVMALLGKGQEMVGSSSTPAAAPPPPGATPPPPPPPPPPVG
jgi:hypothetical protein